MESKKTNLYTQNIEKIRCGFGVRMYEGACVGACLRECGHAGVHASAGDWRTMRTWWVYEAGMWACRRASARWTNEADGQTWAGVEGGRVRAYGMRCVRAYGVRGVRVRRAGCTEYTCACSGMQRVGLVRRGVWRMFARACYIQKGRVYEPGYSGRTNERTACKRDGGRTASDEQDDMQAGWLADGERSDEQDGGWA